MRAALAVIAAISLCATPAVAQGKTKTPAVADAGAVAVEIVEICEEFSGGDVLAVDDATAKGWDAYEATGEGPYVRTFNAHKELPGIGAADIFVLLEDYPTSTLGYCRMDVIEPQVTGHEAVQAIQNLDRYEGQSIQNGEGTFAHLTGANGDTNRMLLAHWSAESFVVQLTIITPKAETAD